MKKSIAILSCTAILAACTSGFDEMNVNPNSMEVGTVSPASLLPNIIYTGASALVSEAYTLSDELMQYSVSSNTTDAYHRFQIPNGTVSSVWNNMARWAASSDHMAKLCEGNGVLCNFEAIAITMRCFYIQVLSDCFGDVPFSEAFNGMNGVNKPKFDTQRDIYLAIVNDLERANTLYDSQFQMTENQKAKDLLYGGDLDRWRKFTNSLLLRALLRVYECNDAEINAKEKINRIFDSPADYPIFATNDDSAIMRFTGEDPNLNPYGSTNQVAFDNNRRAGEAIIDKMAAIGDPRINIYFVQTGGVWKGCYSGGVTREETGASDAAKLNKSTLGDYSSPYSFMNYDEVLFIKAECALRGIIDGGNDLAKECYTKAVEASIRHWAANPGVKTPVSEAAISQFLGKVAFNGTLEQLINQKYVALFWVAFESWNDYRRTGYPELTIAATTFNDHIHPRRLIYPVNTGSTNTENYAAEVELLRKKYKGGDDMKTPVWWSKYRIEKNY